MARSHLDCVRRHPLARARGVCPHGPGGARRPGARDRRGGSGLSLLSGPLPARNHCGRREGRAPGIRHQCVVHWGGIRGNAGSERGQGGVAPGLGKRIPLRASQKRRDGPHCAERTGWPPPSPLDASERPASSSSSSSSRRRCRSRRYSGSKYFLPHAKSSAQLTPLILLSNLPDAPPRPGEG